MIKKSKKIWIFAGESSGDAYGAELAKSINTIAPKELQISISGMGGEKMRSAGVDLMVDSSELGVVGLVEVFNKIFTFIKIFKKLVQKAENERPDLVVLIDYPGFNLRFAKQMKKRGIPVVWYVSPQVWAWGKKRIPMLASFCRKMLVIFPFETQTYAGTGLDVEFTGHPLVDIIRKRSDKNLKRDENLILLLPGSRDNEINLLFLPILEAVAILSDLRPEFKFAVSLNRKSVYENCLRIYEKFKIKQKNPPEIVFYCGETERLMQLASAGIAASGTVTVECAIAGLPLVVIYKVNPITYWVGRMLVKLPYFTMVNIICGELVFREFLQSEVKPQIISSSILEIAPGGARREYVLRKMTEMTNNISCGSEKASDKAAKAVIDVLQE